MFTLLYFKLYLYFTLNCMFTLSRARQSLSKIMRAQHLESGEFTIGCLFLILSCAFCFYALGGYK